MFMAFRGGGECVINYNIWTLFRGASHSEMSRSATISGRVGWLSGSPRRSNRVWQVIEQRRRRCSIVGEQSTPRNMSGLCMPWTSSLDVQQYVLGLVWLPSCTETCWKTLWRVGNSYKVCCETNLTLYRRYTLCSMISSNASILKS